MTGEWEEMEMRNRKKRRDRREITYRHYQRKEGIYIIIYEREPCILPLDLGFAFNLISNHLEMKHLYAKI